MRGREKRGSDLDQTFNTLVLGKKSAFQVWKPRRPRTCLCTQKLCHKICLTSFFLSVCSDLEKLERSAYKRWRACTQALGTHVTHEETWMAACQSLGWNLQKLMFQNFLLFSKTLHSSTLTLQFRVKTQEEDCSKAAQRGCSKNPWTSSTAPKQWVSDGFCAKLSSFVQQV